MANNRVLIRLKSCISFAGILLNIFENGNGKIYILKPSDNSNVVIHIPEDEVERIFGLNGGNL